MDTSNKNRVLVAMIAVVMTLSALAVIFESPQSNSGFASGGHNFSNINEVTNSANAVNDKSVAAMVSAAVTTAQTYAVTFTNIGLPSGMTWTVTIDGSTTLSSTGTSITFQLPNGSHAFSVGKPLNYVADPESGVVFVYGSASTQYITFSLLEYDVTFVQTGLQPGATWSVVLNGVVKTSTTNQIFYSMDNGSYSYSITGPANYAANPGSGKAIVYGGNVTIDVSFISTLHKITFNFGGDIAGTSWTLTFAGDSYTVTGSSLALMKNNGMYGYSVSTANEYAATPSSGSVLVLDKDASVNITIQVKTYTVTFEHVGMEVGVPWQVTFNGVVHNSTSSIITFETQAGNYSYTVSDVNGYTVSSGTGDVNVASQSQYVNVEFNKNPDIWTMPLLIIAGAAIGIGAGVGIGLLYVRRIRPP